MTLAVVVIPALLSISAATFLLIWRQPHVVPFLDSANLELDRRADIGRKLAGTKRYTLNDSIKADLWLAAKDPERFLYEQALAVLGLGVVGLLLGWVLGGPVTIFVLFTFGVFAGWRLPRAQLAAEVLVKRQELLAALSFWAQLIAASVGGSQAVTAAARSNAERGEGWAWDLFRDACNKADAGRETLPELLRQTAANAGLPELAAFAESIEAATERGSVVQETMANQSEAILKKVHDQQMQTADDRSNAMVVPVGLLFAAFVLFLFFIVVESLSIAF